jgi:hypothetical protein
LDQPEWTEEPGYSGLVLWSRRLWHCNASTETDCRWLHGDEIIDINGRRLRVEEVVPYNQVSASPDGYFWRCHTVESKNYDVHGHVDWVDGERRCFFAPPQSL